MKKAIYLILSIPLIFFFDNKVQAQRVESSYDRPHLALVKGDNNNSCSFMSADLLERTADIVQGLLFVTPEDNEEQVRYKMRFPPDQLNAHNALQWTALAQRNYTKAVVYFGNNAVQKRTFTMAINYNQPNQKQCSWEVRQPSQRLEANPPVSPVGQ